MGEKTNEPTIEQTNEPTSEQANEPMNDQTNELTNEEINEPTHVFTMCRVCSYLKVLKVDSCDKSLLISDL